jgi:hypothetical protein
MPFILPELKGLENPRADRFRSDLLQSRGISTANGRGFLPDSMAMVQADNHR